MKTEPVKQLDSYELTARPMVMDDIPALHALSTGVQWPHRPEDWAMLIRVGHGVVAEDAIGRVVGSAMWWPMNPDLAIGRGHVVGPVVAASEEDALALVAPHVAAHAGRFLRLDTREAEEPFRADLQACGLSLFDTGTSMSLGRDQVPEGPARFYGWASHSLG